MRKIFYSLVILVTLTAVSCSYDDKSTYPDYSKENFTIDTTGLYWAQYVTLGDTFNLSPKIDYKDFDESKFTYQWDITLQPEVMSVTAAPTNFQGSYQTISTDRELSWVAVSEAAANPYGLRLTVTNEANGQKKRCGWYLYIQSLPTKGIMVAYSANGTTGDLSLIMDPIFNTRVDAPSVHSKYYSEGMGKEFAHVISNLMVKRDYDESGVAKDWLYINAPTHIEQFGIASQKTYMQDDDFYFDPTSGKPFKDAYVFCSHANKDFTQNVMFYNDGGFWSKYRTTPTNVADSKIGMCWNNLRAFAEIGGYNEYLFDPMPPIAEGKGSWMFFDKKNKVFVPVKTSNPKNDKYNNTQVKNSDNIAQFNPDYLKDWTPIYGGPGGAATSYYFVMQNGANYALAIVSTAKCVKWIDLSSAPEIDKAISFKSPSNQTVLFYGTSTGKLYSVFADLRLASPKITLEHDFGAQIDCLKFIESNFGYSPLPLPIPAAPGEWPADWDEKYLVIGTSTSQTSGTIHLVQLSNIGSGNIDKVVSQYSIPGRVTAITNVE